MQAYPAGNGWLRLRMLGALPSKDPVLASSPVPCSKKNSVARPNRGLSVSLRIPGEADPRRRIKYVAVHAAFGHSIFSTLHESIGDSRVQIREIERNGLEAWKVDELPRVRINFHLRSQCLAESVGIPVESPQVFLVVVAKQTEPNAQVHCDSRSDSPVVLNEWFRNLVPVVIAQLGAVLKVALDGVASTARVVKPIVVEEISKSVASAVNAAVHIAYSQKALQIAGSRAQRCVG